MNILIIEDEKKTALLLRDMIEIHAERLVVNVCESLFIVKKIEFYYKIIYVNLVSKLNVKKK